MLSVEKEQLVSIATPGTRLIAVGIYSISGGSSEKGGEAATIRNPFLQVVGMQIVDSSSSPSSAGRGFSSFSRDEDQMFMALSRSPDIYSLLCKSVAPAIFGHEGEIHHLSSSQRKKKEKKKKTLISLPSSIFISTASNRYKEGFGLSFDERFQKNPPRWNEIERRHQYSSVGRSGNCKVSVSQVYRKSLLIFSFFSSKLLLVRFTNTREEKVAPIGVYTSGKGSSAAGLTASVVRDSHSVNLLSFFLFFYFSLSLFLSLLFFLFLFLFLCLFSSSSSSVSFSSASNPKFLFLI